MEDSAKFCPSCGTPVSGRVPERRTVEHRGPGGFFAFFLIAVILGAVLLGVLAFLPIRPVSFHEVHEVPFQSGVQAVVVDLTVDVGNVNVAFEDLASDMVTLDLSMSGYGSIISPQLPTVSFQHVTNSNILLVTSRVETSIFYRWLSMNFLQTDCNLIIDSSLNATINVKTSIGKITFETTQRGVVLNSLSLETATGAIEASFVEDTTVTRDISIRTVVGAISLSWQNVIAKRDVAVNLVSVTGATSVSVIQDERLQNKVDLEVEVTTGAINLGLTISGDVAGRITSSTTTGSVDVQRSDDFSPTTLSSASQIQSNNYPSTSQFDINLQTTTGRIGIDARHTS
jgi:hypothetical protein